MGMIHVYVLFQRMIFSPTFAMMIPTNFVALPGDKTTGVLLACERRVFFSVPSLNPWAIHLGRLPNKKSRCSKPPVAILFDYI